jgi:hypothetical protein
MNDTNDSGCGCNFAEHPRRHEELLRLETDPEVVAGLVFDAAHWAEVGPANPCRIHPVDVSEFVDQHPWQDPAAVHLLADVVSDVYIASGQAAVAVAC